MKIKEKVLIALQVLLCILMTISLYLLVTETDNDKTLCAASLFLFYAATYCLTLPSSRSQIKA